MIAGFGSVITDVIPLKNEDSKIKHLQWPDEFINKTPMVTFGVEFISFLKEMNASGATITADETWTTFAIRRDNRIVDFTRRGRLGRGRPECWEVRPCENGHELQLGVVFGIRDYACVVTAGLEYIQTISKMWLSGSDIESLVRCVSFWDKMGTGNPLELPTNHGAENA